MVYVVVAFFDYRKAYFLFENSYGFDVFSLLYFVIYIFTLLLKFLVLYLTFYTSKQNQYMKASTNNNDLYGTVAVDIADHLGEDGNDNFKSVSKFFNIDENRFQIVGLSIYGVDGFFISLFCIDKEKSTKEKEHIVKMGYEDRDTLEALFKRLHIVLHKSPDDKYNNIDYDEEVGYDDFHETKEEE